MGFDKEKRRNQKKKKLKEKIKIRAMDCLNSEATYSQENQLGYKPKEDNKDFSVDETLFGRLGKDLDILGYYFDYAKETIVEEDEESNFYSIDRGNHEDLGEGIILVFLQPSI